jgi:hypothetical protein
MIVKPDHPVPDDKVQSSNSLDYFLIPENPVSSPEDDFSIKCEPMDGGKMYTIVNPQTGKSVKHLACDLPTFRDNAIFQYNHQYKDDCERIPDGCLWQCDVCGAVYEARSRHTMDRLGMKRRWARMRWYSFNIRKRWNALSVTGVQ